MSSSALGLARVLTPLGLGLFASLMVSVVACDNIILESDIACEPEGEIEACYPGNINQSSVGACQPGVKVCRDGRFSACEGYVLPNNEACGDGVDNDCDGISNEFCACEQGGEPAECYTGPRETKNIGECKSGTQACVDGFLNDVCDGEVLPAAGEICGDGKDNNCNGSVDEGCQCESGATRACYTGPSETKDVGTCDSGTAECVDGSWPSECSGQVLPTTETCNGLDDDCDGEIDEGAEGTGGDCVVSDLSADCTAGRYTCSEGQLVCEALSNGAEKCDGKDNDCNGKVDDITSGKLIGKPCVPDIPTQNGCYVTACIEGNVGCVLDPKAMPSKEDCNGIDDDCDGAVDEGKICPSGFICYQGNCIGMGG